jgi:hypothetical protein
MSALLQEADMKWMGRALKFPDREFAFHVLFGTIPCSESQGNSSEVPVIATNLDEMNCH